MRLSEERMKKAMSPGRVATLAAGIVLLGLAACETTPPPEPAPTPTPTPTPTIETTKYEPWMGPVPRAAPVADVGVSTLKPAAPSTILSSKPAPVQVVNEPPGLIGVTAEHAHQLTLRRKPPLGWSDALARRASLQAQQMSYSMCGRNRGDDFSARGEAVRIEPPANGPSGARPANLSARQIVGRWASQKVGAFAPENATAGRLGCAVNACPDGGQIVVCRFD